MINFIGGLRIICYVYQQLDCFMSVFISGDLFRGF